MDPATLSGLTSLTGGGGLDAGSSAGGNDRLQGGANITFGYIPPIPSLPSLGSNSVSVQSNGYLIWLVAAALAILAFFYLKRGRK